MFANLLFEYFIHLKLCQNLLNYVEIYGDKSSVKKLK